MEVWNEIWKIFQCEKEESQYRMEMDKKWQKIFGIKFEKTAFHPNPIPALSNRTVKRSAIWGVP